MTSHASPDPAPFAAGARLAAWRVVVGLALLPFGGAAFGAEPAESALAASVHASLACADCHDGYDAGAAAAGRSPGRVDCLSCHEKLERSHAFHPDFGAVPAVATKQTECVACHGTHGIAAPRGAFDNVRLSEVCGTCHREEVAHFRDSAHGTALAAGHAEAPTCLSCHRNGAIRGGGKVAAKLAQSQLCLACHLSDPRVVDRGPFSAHFIEGYGQSVHGVALARGNGDSANCVDCHGSHEMNGAMVAGARVNRRHVPETCARCHPRIAQEYRVSVHGVALAKGNVDAPNCSECHNGEHRILFHADPNSAVSARNVSRVVCGSCHGSVRLSQRYGLSADRFSTFADSYHGLATRGGSTEAVNCASCHGAHEIRHSNDPLSSVAKANLAKTCGQCHPGANARFAIGSVHVNEKSKDTDPWIYWVATIYVWLIIVVVGGMAGHNLLDFVKKVRRKIALQRGDLAEPVLPHRLYLRMTVNERIQHGTLVLSFATLVLTGFMLRYPEAWWVMTFRGWSDHVFEWRGLLHRIAGCVMLAAGVWHLGYLGFTARGRQLFLDLFPRWSDLTDALGVLRYNLGLAREKPRFGRFSYIEKSEYWALVWGTLIMGATGFVLWFENTFISLFTKLGYDIARTVHFYEAILATLAIIVWHFYFVIFNPDVYPMNLSWLTGRMSEKEMAEEHPAELERLKAGRRDEAVAAEDSHAEPPPPAPGIGETGGSSGGAG